MIGSSAEEAAAPAEEAAPASDEAPAEETPAESFPEGDAVGEEKPADKDSPS